MTKIKLTLSFYILMLYSISAQQIPNSSHFSETRTAWNPAFTAVGNNMIFDGLFRSQWLGFSGAPLSGYLSFQFPFLDYNMSAGALLNFDQTGPISKLGMQLNYAYKLKKFLGRYDQLSLGISGNIQQYSFKSSALIFNDEDDMLIQSGKSGSIFSSFGSGFYYTSSVREYKENVFFIGAAINQIYATPVQVSNFDQEREKHFHLNAGGRFYNYDTYIEPMFTVNLVKPDILDVLYSLRFEKENTFWAGVGYANSGMASLQGGVMFDRFGNRFGQLKIGILSSYGVGTTLSRTGPGIELYIGYNLNLK